MTPLLLLVAAFATYRATRLVTADQITEPIRIWVIRRSRWAGYLVTCDWCFSIWVAPWVAVAIIRHRDNDIIMGILIALALSAVTGILAIVERRLDS